MIYCNLYLKSKPDHVNAMRTWPLPIEKARKKLQDAEALLRSATRLAPDFILLGSIWDHY
jgi:type IV secretory pathway ATPase VirB11/archaellum biosynthesis ATPase